MAFKPGAPRPPELTLGSPQRTKIVDYTAKLVVRGGVEPPTFRFSEGYPGPQQSIKVSLTGPDDGGGALASTVVPTCPHLLLAQR